MVSALIRFWKLLQRRDRLRVVLGMVLVVFGSILETVGVGLLPMLVAVLSVPHTVQQKLVSYTGWHFFQEVDLSRFVLMTTTFVCVFFILKNIYSMWSTYWLGHFKAQLQAKLGRKLIHGYFNAPYDWHFQRSSSTIQQTVQQEVYFLASRILGPMYNLISEMGVIVFVVGLLMFVAPLATLIAGFVIAVASVGYSSFFNVRLEKLGQEQKKVTAVLYQCVQHGLGGIKELKVLGRTAYFEKQYDSMVDIVAVADQLQQTIGINMKSVLEGLAVVCLSLAVFTNLLLHRDMQLLLPSLALFSVAAIRLMPSAYRVVVARTTMKYGLAGFYRLLADLEEIQTLSLLQVEPAPAEAKGWIFREKIEITGLFYNYPGVARSCLSGISLTIRKGESVGFVGPSGAGKTTLVDLILGLLVPVSGTIEADGKNIQECLPAWRAQIGYIPQNIYLSDSTVRSNVAFGIPENEIDDERIWAALKAAFLLDLVESWPEKLEQRVGEAGVRLSGGQRQRIGIARALYHNPAILVMDEATAALDNETERDIVSVLETFRGEKTLIMIAHRLTTVQRCDHLFYLNEGRIMASGSYRQLEAESALFQQMIQASASEAKGI